MEPRAISNMNGMLVPSPVRNNARGSQPPSTPSNNRRASSLWVWSPTKSGEDDADADHDNADDAEEDNEEVEWSALTPVPKTPAPEAIARFAANISPGFDSSPSSVGSSADSEDPLGLDRDDDDQDTDDAHSRQEKLLRTCPPKRTAFVEPGEGILGTKDRDQGVMMRLMAARRKSLQFAPKVGSPLAKTWKAWN
jgi:hypothetical protein